jgi:hypothetical protein
MQARTLYIAAGALALFALLFSGFAYVSTHAFHKDIPLTTERELKVTLDAGFGDVSISRGKSSVVVDADISTEKDNDLGDYFDYVSREGIGYLTVNTNAEVRSHSHKHSINFDGFHSNTWDMKFTDAIPISFELGLGLGEGDIDLTGLNVKDLKLSAGASSVKLRFDRPNKSVIENMTIESGLSKFEGEGLCNANFNRMKFEGGVGSYTLDFSGELKKEVDVNIEVGLGSLIVYIPEDIGAKIIYEKNWIAHFDLDKDFTEKEEDNYYSSNYRSAEGKMNIRVEAGLGAVKIRRVR